MIGGCGAACGNEGAAVLIASRLLLACGGIIETPAKIPAGTAPLGSPGVSNREA